MLAVGRQADIQFVVGGAGGTGTASQVEFGPIGEALAAGAGLVIAARAVDDCDHRSRPYGDAGTAMLVGIKGILYQ